MNPLDDIFIPYQRPAIRPSEVFEFARFIGLTDKQALSIVNWKKHGPSN